MDADGALLARLVGDVDHFASSIWGRRSLHRTSGTSFEDVLSIDGIERLLASAARRPTFRLVRDGVTLPVDRSTRTLRMAGATLDDVADLARIAGAVDEGATLVLQGLQRTSIELAELCRGLERATSHPVQANAYLTPGGAAGLARHHDDHDVLVLQVAGSKAWDIEDLGPRLLVAGDVAYLPAGTRHEAAAQEGMSLHLTLGLLRVTWRELVGRAVADVPGLDQPLPLGYGRSPDLLARELRQVLDRTAEHLASADAPALADREADRALDRRLPLPLGQLRSVLALPSLDVDAVVRRRPDHRATIDDGAADGRFVLRLVDRSLELSDAARPAVEQLLGAEAIRVGDLADLEPHGQLVLARRLVREGLLVVSG